MHSCKGLGRGFRRLETPKGKSDYINLDIGAPQV